MKLIYIILALVALVSAETPNPRIWDDYLVGKYQTINIRKIVESWTPAISHLIVKNHLDPFGLPVFKEEFWVPFPGIPLLSYKAQLSLDSGGLKGLSNLKFNDATLTYENRIIKLGVSVEFALLSVAYDYDLKLRLLHPKGVIRGDVKTLRADTIISFDTTSYKLGLDQFHLQSLNIKNVSIENRSGWKYLILSTIANIVAILNKKNITESAQNAIIQSIRSELDDINLHVPPELVAEFFEKLLQLQPDS